MRNTLFFNVALSFFFISCASIPGKSSSPESKKFVRVAVINFHIKGGQSLPDHLLRLNDLSKRAREKGATYALFPELTVFDLLPHEPEESEIPKELGVLANSGEAYEEGLVRIARTHGIHLIGASAVMSEENKFLNRAFFITPEGAVQHQDKVYPTPWETRYGFRGGGEIKKFQTQEMSFVILICHDAEFPEISQDLVLMRPEVIFVPSQTDDEHGLERVRLTSAARAVEHFALVLMTGASGDASAPWHSYQGRNFLFTPRNKYYPETPRASEFPFREEISFYDLDLDALRTGREDPRQVYPARDSRLAEESR